MCLCNCFFLYSDQFMKHCIGLQSTYQADARKTEKEWDGIRHAHTTRNCTNSFTGSIAALDALVALVISAWRARVEHASGDGTTNITAPLTMFAALECVRMHCSLLHQLHGAIYQYGGSDGFADVLRDLSKSAQRRYEACIVHA